MAFDVPLGGRVAKFPQAHTHLAPINAVMHVIEADSDLAGAAEAYAEDGRPAGRTNKRRHGGVGR